MENLSPNQTRFSLQRSDPISRYRFVLRARTQVGEGEALMEESPALLDEGKGSARLCRGDGGVTGRGKPKKCHRGRPWQTQKRHGDRPWNSPKMESGNPKIQECRAAVAARIFLQRWRWPNAAVKTQLR